MNAEFTKAVEEIKAMSETVTRDDMVSWKLVWQAMSAVSDAEDTQQRLLRQIDSLAHSLDRARRDIEGEDSMFNTCGIVQSLGTAVDRQAGEMAARVEDVIRWRRTLDQVLPAAVVAQAVEG